MIAHSRAVALGAVGLALGLHIAALAANASRDQIQIEGGAPGAAAAFGSSFADMAAGSAAPVTPDLQPARTRFDPAQPAAAEPVQTDVPAPDQTPAETADLLPEPLPDQIAATPVTPAAADLTQTPPAHAPIPVEGTEAAQPTPQDPAPQTPMTVTPVTAPAATAVTAVATAEPTTASPRLQVAALQPTTQSPATVPAVPALSALEHAPRATTPSQSRRPAARPEHLTAKTPPPQPKSQARTQAKSQPKTQAKPKPKAQQQAGNADRNAKKGTATGKQKTGSAASTSTASRSKTAGNAAISNYQGKVYRRIARAKPRNVNTRGTARVSLTISGGGSLSGVRISRSSGSAKLDQIALTQVRRAAPFPPTPTGEAMSFSISIKGGG